MDKLAAKRYLESYLRLTNAAKNLERAQSEMVRWKENTVRIRSELNEQHPNVAGEYMLGGVHYLIRTDLTIEEMEVGDLDEL